MPKQPNIRPSYQSDAKYFRRLSHAVENDLTKPVWWRARIMQRINILVREFEAADNVEETQEAQEEDASGLRGTQT